MINCCISTNELIISDHTIAGGRLTTLDNILNTERHTQTSTM